MKTKSIISSILILCFLSLHSCGDSFLKKQLKLSVTMINRTTPMMLDEITRLDNAEYIPEKTLKYNYTIVTLSKEDIFDSTAFEESIRENLIDGVRKNFQLKTFKKYEVIFIYSYKDKNGELIKDFTITKKDYNEE